MEILKGTKSVPRIIDLSKIYYIKIGFIRLPSKILHRTVHTNGHDIRLYDSILWSELRSLWILCLYFGNNERPFTYY